VPLWVIWCGIPGTTRRAVRDIVDSECTARNILGAERKGSTMMHPKGNSLQQPRSSNVTTTLSGFRVLSCGSRVPVAGLHVTTRGQIILCRGQRIPFRRPAVTARRRRVPISAGRVFQVRARVVRIAARLFPVSANSVSAPSRSVWTADCPSGQKTSSHYGVSTL
jgi:hypothetical protein